EIAFSTFSSACMVAMNTRGQESGWRYAARLSSGMVARSVQSVEREKGRLSSSIFLPANLQQLRQEATMSNRNKPITILLADDDPDDRQLTREAFEENHLANDLRFVEDGQELMDYLNQRGKYAVPGSAPTPGLILLDLNMPRKDGREALQEIKADPRLRNI